MEIEQEIGRKLSQDNKLSMFNKKTSERYTSRENQKENRNATNAADDSMVIMKKLNLGNQAVPQRNNLLQMP